MKVQLGYEIGKSLEQRLAKNSVKFVKLHHDQATVDFLRHRKPENALKRLAHSFLRIFVSHYDANATLNMFPLHLFSKMQFEAILKRGADREAKTLKDCLDIGTGDGSIIKSILRPETKIQGTETSKRMTQRARENGVDCFHLDITNEKFSKSLPEDLDGPYDLVTVFNVLDRTDKPKTLLKQTHALMKPDGLCMIATPLPIKGVFQDGTSIKKPSENLGKQPSLRKTDDDWDRNCEWFILDVLRSANLKPVAFTRIPYISVGDYVQRFIIHDDVCVICEKAEQSKK